MLKPSLSKHIPVLLILLIFLTMTSTYAQIYNTYTAFKFVFPVGEASDYYQNGWGVSGTSNFTIIPKFDLLFEASWYNLSGKKIHIPDQGSFQIENLSVLGLSLGAGYNLGICQVGIKGGYFFDDLHEWDLVPYAQVFFWRLAAGIDYKGMLGNKKIRSAAIYLAYRWW